MKHQLLKKVGVILFALVILLTTLGMDFVRDREPNWYTYISGHRYPNCLSQLSVSINSRVVLSQNRRVMRPK